MSTLQHVRDGDGDKCEGKVVWRTETAPSSQDIDYDHKKGMVKLGESEPVDEPIGGLWCEGCADWVTGRVAPFDCEDIPELIRLGVLSVKQD